MKCANVCIVLVVFSLAMCMSACAGKPTDSINRTEQARAEASAEHAEQFAMDEWSQGEKAWQEASAKLDAQSYSDATNLLLRAREHYIKARDAAKSLRAAKINEITDLQGTARLQLKARLQDDPGIKNLSGPRKKELDDTIKQLNSNIEKVTAQLQNAQYTEAETLIQKTLRDIYETQQEYLKK